jgi:protoheme IX farnesyltransferase
MPNVKGAPRTRLEIIIYSVLLFGLTQLPLLTGLGGTVYGIGNLLLSGTFLVLAWRVYRSRAGDKPTETDSDTLYAVRNGNHAARNLFLYSILYLFALFAVLTVDHLFFARI